MIILTITLWHKTHGFGSDDEYRTALNTNDPAAWTARDRAWETYQPSDAPLMRAVHTFRFATDDDRTDADICDWVYAEFQSNRTVPIRSLSIGDLIQIEDSYYAVTPGAFVRVDAPVVDA